MKVLLSILPSFEQKSYCLPSTGLACIKAYLKEKSPETNIKLIDLRTEKEVHEIWRPDDFPGITIRKAYVSDIYELSLMASLIHNYKKTKSITKSFPSKEVIEKWSYDRTILPEFITSKLELTHKFALKHLTKFGGYDIVGFSTYTSNLYLTLLMAIFIKITYPNTKIVFGGPQITQSDSTRELLLKGSVADFLVLGEGEKPFLDILNALTNNYPTDKIIGVKTPENLDRLDTFYQEMDLESLPTPDYDDISFQNYGHKLISIYSNRGCPFRCHFCAEHSLFGKTFKRRSPEKVVEDMIKLHKKLGTNTFHFADSLVNSSDEWLDKFVELLSKTEQKFLWEGYFRAEIKEAMVKKMKAVGLRKTVLGVESFAQDTLDHMNKKKVKQEILDTITYLADNEINTTINILVGYPEEKESDFITTLGIVKDLKKKYKASVLRIASKTFQLRPFSNVYKVYDKFGLSATTWESIYDEKYHGEELKSVFEKTLYSFSINGISIGETLHRLNLVNQVRYFDMFLNEKTERYYSMEPPEE